MPTVHPSIAKKIDELLAHAKELTISQQETMDLLSKCIDHKDFWGMKARVSEVTAFAEKIQWITAQVNALHGIPYDVASYEAGRRRPSSQTMQAVKLKDEPDK